jgi:hypothetical protein
MKSYDEYAQTKHRKRHIVLSEDDTIGSSPPIKRASHPKKVYMYHKTYFIMLTSFQKVKKGKGTVDLPISLDSDIEMSDGESGLRRVLAKEAASGERGGKRGPTNKTIQHWHEPKPARVNGKLVWEYSCKYCTSYVIHYYQLPYLILPPIQLLHCSP